MPSTVTASTASPAVTAALEPGLVGAGPAVVADGVGVDVDVGVAMGVGVLVGAIDDDALGVADVPRSEKPKLPWIG